MTRFEIPEEQVTGSLLPPRWADVAEVEIEPVGPASIPRPLYQRAIKRGIDIAASLVLIGVLLPFVIVIALAVLLDSRGPLMFVQRRVGRNGREFPLLKFRTMVVEGEAALAAHMISDAELLQEWERSRKLRNDPRVTRVGQFLRRHSVDELPQIINVLRGHMSLVGPRPVPKEETAYFGERSPQILSVRPGLTGLWAVSGRSDISYHERAELEYRYAIDWSLRMDLSILLRTIPVVLHGHGAY